MALTRRPPTSPDPGRRRILVDVVEQIHQNQNNLEILRCLTRQMLTRWSRRQPDSLVRPEHKIPKKDCKDLFLQLG